MARKSTEVRKEEIKLAVLKIIREEGIKSISTKNLAKYTNLSEGAIFRHFKSKRDIIIAIIDDVAKDMIGNLEKIATSSIEPKQRLFDFLCSHIQYLTTHQGITILLFTEASQQNDTQMIEKLNHIFNTQRKLVAKILEAGISQKIWNKNTSIEDASFFYMGIPITYNISIILSKSDSDYTDFCKRMMHLLERMLQ
ncbi:MAG TPA: TetR/AcrR family transcriptional regulator [Flavobacteriia bacterium]|nr:TetR/AcrR family transcriptional regulator [Flavobacteriia bacterium]